MIPILSYRLQEQAFRALSADARQRLNTVTRTIEANPNVDFVSSPVVKPGTRLVRQWQDEAHIVEVHKKGFEYKGARYCSLSQVARLITGTRWSGPLFFGLKRERRAHSKEVK